VDPARKFWQLPAWKVHFQLFPTVTYLK
jgi:hypothetical protein